MPLDPTKLHALILAHATSHDDTDDCEFCKFTQELASCTQFLEGTRISANIMALTEPNAHSFFINCFMSGFICGVKMERARVMEEEFKV